MSSAFVPPDKGELERVYNEKAPLYKQLADEVHYILCKNLPKNQIAISSIEPRLKEFDSFYEKIKRKEYKGNVFEKVEDIAGVRILCAYRSDLDKIEEMIREKFTVVKANIMHKRTDLVFGYMSDHYLVQLPRHYRGERYDAIKSLKCEIQVRTVAMHAWATVSHQLDYKQEIDIPSDLKNDFYALSGIFYIADSLFEQFKSAREKSMQKLSESIEQRGFNLDDEVNLDTMTAYLSWKFPDRKVGSRNAVSMLLSEMKRKGIIGFHELNKIIDVNLEWFIQLENKYPPLGEENRGVLYNAVGVPRLIIRERVRKRTKH